MELVMRHDFECDQDVYWKCVFDDEYNKRLYVDLLKFRECTKLSFEDKGDVITRRIKLNPPPTDLPGPVAKVVGDLSWVEEGSYDKKTHKYKVKVVTASMPDKTRISGENWTEPKGDKKCVRVARFDIEVKVFMVGGIVEKRIAEDMKKSYDAAAKFTNEFVKEKGW
jgi:hypothetical protein